MPGTKAGSAKAVQTIYKKYGSDFFVRAGRRGGQNGHVGGFNSYKVGEDGLTGFERAKIAGAKGGRISRRTGVKNGEGKTK